MTDPVRGYDEGADALTARYDMPSAFQAIVQPARPTAVVVVLGALQSFLSAGVPLVESCISANCQLHR